MALFNSKLYQNASNYPSHRLGMITTLVAQCRPAWWAAQCNAVKPRVSRALISQMRDVAFVRTESGDFMGASWGFMGF